MSGDADGRGAGVIAEILHNIAKNVGLISPGRNNAGTKSPGYYTIINFANKEGRDELRFAFHADHKEAVKDRLDKLAQNMTAIEKEEKTRADAIKSNRDGVPGASLD